MKLELVPRGLLLNIIFVVNQFELKPTHFFKMIISGIYLTNTFLSR